MIHIDCRSLYTDKNKPWRFQLLTDVVVKLSNGGRLIIPKGYITDFATVPRIFRGVIWGAGNHNLATLIHDYLYDNQIGTRLQADKEMLYWLEKAGCSRIKRYAMYYAVRLGGKSWWEN